MMWETRDTNAHMVPLHMGFCSWVEELDDGHEHSRVAIPDDSQHQVGLHEIYLWKGCDSVADLSSISCPQTLPMSEGEVDSDYEQALADGLNRHSHRNLYSPAWNLQSIYDDWECPR